MAVVLILTDAQADLLVTTLAEAWRAALSTIPAPAQDMTHNEEMTWRAAAASARHRAAMLSEILELVIKAIQRPS